MKVTQMGGFWDFCEEKAFGRDARTKTFRVQTMRRKRFQAPTWAPCVLWKSVVTMLKDVERGKIIMFKGVTFGLVM